MKYLFLILRHIFPRRRWIQIDSIDVRGDGDIPLAVIIILRDQFGNLKAFKIKN